MQEHAAEATRDVQAKGYGRDDTRRSVEMALYVLLLMRGRTASRTARCAAMAPSFGFGSLRVLPAGAKHSA